jgi:hypothetical protein
MGLAIKRGGEGRTGANYIIVCLFSWLPIDTNDVKIIWQLSSFSGGERRLQKCPFVHYFRHRRVPKWNQQPSINLLNSFLICKYPKSLIRFNSIGEEQVI